MDINALFKVQCGLFVAAVDFQGKRNGCITNTLMQQSHVPVKFSVTLEKKHFTHELILAKKSLGISILSDRSPVDIIKRFGFASGREKDKFDGIDYELDCNGNPILGGEQIAATLSLKVYELVDIGTHTLFLCTADGASNLEQEAITYSGYRSGLKNNMK